jgi:CRP/FNR family transcriptional regulator, cyclic AMP receptor protein
MAQTVEGVAMGKKEALEMLGSVAIFEGLDSKELDHIYSAAKEVSFPAGRPIVSEGESGAAFHLILEGTAEVSVGGDAKTTLGPGDYFGEMSLIDEGPRSATVTAKTAVHTVSLVSWSFLPLLDEMPSVARKMMIQMSKRLRRSEATHTH